MLGRQVMGLATKCFAVLALVISSAGPALAQSENPVGAIGNFLGALAQAGSKAKAQKEWQAQDAQVIQCVNTIYAEKNITADNFVAAGVGPNDPRVAPLINICKVVMTTPPKTNFPCNVTDANGQQIGTTCSESYAVSRNGSLIAVSRDDFLRAAGNGEQVQIANFETAEANAARNADVRLQRTAQEGGNYLNWTKVDEQDNPRGGYRFEVYWGIISEQSTIKKVKWAYNFYPINGNAKSRAQVELVNCDKKQSMITSDEFYTELWGDGASIPRTYGSAKSGVTIFPGRIAASDYDLYNSICSASASKQDASIAREWASGEERFKREVAEAPRRPRGYRMICSGWNAEGNYNYIKVNCESAAASMSSLRWAYQKLLADGQEDAAKLCLSVLGKASGFAEGPSYAASAFFHSGAFLQGCNLGLQNVKGPSALQASGRRK